MRIDIEKGLQNYEGKCMNAECGKEFSTKRPFYLVSNKWLCGNCKSSAKDFCNFSLIEKIDKQTKINSLDRKNMLGKRNEDDICYTEPYGNGLVAKLEFNYCSASNIGDSLGNRMLGTYKENI